MTVPDILKDWLTEHGYDGLCGDKCGCELSDLAPCGCWPYDCKPGYKRLCANCSEADCEFRGDVNWCIRSDPKGGD